MPELSGTEVIKRFREWEQENRQNSQRQVVIAATASPLEEDKRRALEAGFDYFLPKPISKVSLLNKIQEIFDRLKEVV